MKKVAVLSLATLLAVFLAACGSPAQQAAQTTAQEPTEAATNPDVIVFNDPVLEQMVREQMNKPEGDITITEAKQVKELDFDLEWQPEIPPETQIHDISALQYFVNLEKLEFNCHAVSDLSPLTSLTKLRGLSFACNPVTDLSPLSSMPSLSGLIMFSVNVDDYSPIQDLPRLSTLMISWTSFSDLTLLDHAPDLRTLYIDNTQVSDLSPLANHANLTALHLDGCQATDLSPLKDSYPNLTDKDFEMN